MDEKLNKVCEELMSECDEALRRYHEMFPAQNLELFYWNDEAGDMDCEVYPLNWHDDLPNIEKIEILVMDYPICDEVAIVTYKGDYPVPADTVPLYITDDDDKVIFTTVAYSPNPEYNDVLISDSLKEAARYVLYSESENINRIEKFRFRENPMDIPDWR